MATSSLYDQSELLTHFLSQGPFTYVLTTNPPAGTESLGAIGRTDYPNYSDVTVLLGDFTSQSVVSGATQVSNASDINFPTPTGNGTHTIGGFAIYDGSNNIRRYGPLQSVLPAPQSGQPIKTPAGQLVISQA